MKRTRLLAIIIPAFFVFVMLAYAKAKSHSTPLPAEAPAAKPIPAPNPSLSAALRLPRPAPTPPGIVDVIGVGGGRGEGVGSLSLDGSGSYVLVPNSPSLDLTGPFTVEAWIRPNVAAPQGIVERYNWSSTADGGFALRLTDEGKVQLLTVRSEAENDSVTGGTILSIGDWHHVAGVFDGSELRVYVDGVLDGDKGSSLVPASGTADLRIGALPDDTGFFDGLIDEVRLTSGIRYAAINFEPELEFTTAGLVLGPGDIGPRGVWCFKDGDASDSSAQENHGTLVGKAGSFTFETALQGPTQLGFEPQAPTQTSPSLNFDELNTGIIVETHYFDLGKNIKFFSQAGYVIATYHSPDHDKPQSQPNSITAFNFQGVDARKNLQVDFPEPVRDLRFFICDIESLSKVASMDVYQNGVKTRDGIPIFGNSFNSIPYLLDFRPLGLSNITRIVIYNIDDIEGLTYDNFDYSFGPIPIPSPPTSLVSSVQNTQVSLSWHSSVDASSYRVKRSTVSGGPYQTIGSPSATNFVDSSNLIKGATYYYVVTAANPLGQESGNSNQTIAVIPNPRPDPLATLRAVPDEEAITVLWEVLPNASEYIIRRTNTQPPQSPDSPVAPQTPMEITISCSQSPCKFADPGPNGEPLDSDSIYNYEVAGRNSAGTGDFVSVSRQPLQKPGCEWRNKNSPLPNGTGIIQVPAHLGWSMSYQVSPMDGLVLYDIVLNNRKMASRFSIPYFHITTCRTCATSDPTRIPDSRGELRPNGSFNTDGTLRSRLIEFNKKTLPDKLLLQAIYGIDKIPGAPQACLKITQDYEFFKMGWDVPTTQTGPCEPYKVIDTCSKFRPKVTYNYTRKETDFLLESLNIPERLAFQVKSNEANTIALTRDLDESAGPLGIGTYITGHILNEERNKIPLTTEWWAPVIVRGKDGGTLDNFHQTQEKDFKPPKLGWSPFGMVWPGCPECVHMHWRWSKVAPGESFGTGQPLIKPGSRQDLDIAVALYRQNEEHPVDYGNTIAKINGVNETIRDDQDNRFPAVFWYSPTGRQDSDEFFWNPAWFNYKDPAAPSAPLELRAIGTPMVPTADGPTTVIFGDIYRNGQPTIQPFDLSTLGPLPPGYVALNNAGYLIGTDENAVVSGPHTVNFIAQSVSDQNTFDKLRIFNIEPDPYDPERPVWVDRTILPPDTPAPNFSARTLSARSEKLGVFVIARQAQVIPPDTNVADVGVTVSDSSDPIMAGNQLVYTLTVTNHGPQTATEVALRNSMSPDVDFVSVNPTQGTCKEIQGAVYCSPGTLNPGASMTVTIIVTPTEGTISFPSTGKLLSHHAMVRAKQIDNNHANNSEIESTNVLPNPNQAPVVSFTSPASETSVIGPTNITLNALATDPDGNISKVEFFDNGELFAEGTQSGNNFSTTRLNASNGQHAFYAFATDNGGRHSKSDPLFVFVNSTAAVSIQSPSANSFFTPGGNISISVSAVPSAGRTISKVEFIADNTLLGEGTLSGGLYRFEWQNVPAGIRVLRAIATDQAELVTLSAPVKITIATPPAVSITTPVDRQVLPAGSNFTISATATSSFGRIMKVDFYANGNLIGTGNDISTTTFSAIWRQPVNGLYSLTAVAWDEMGISNTSNTITVGVNTAVPEPGDFIWFDDKAPDGAALFGNRDWWYWVDSNPAPLSGTLAHQSLIANGFHEHGFENAGFKLPVNADDKLYTYVFISPGFKPQELMLGFKDQTGSWEHRAYWTDKAEGNWVNFGVDGTVSRHRMGPIPAEGGWVRLEIPAADVGLAGKTLTGMTFILYGGRATFDRTGKSNRSTPAPQAPADFAWFDDALPAGAIPGFHDDTWTFVTANPAPFHGLKAHQTFQGTSGDSNEYRQHFFTGATQTMQVDPGDVLFTYVYLDPDQRFKPDEIVLQWHDGSSWNHRAYWGSSYVFHNRLGTEGMRYMGALPPAGSWARLEVPASYVGLEGKTVSGMSFDMNREGGRGRATWDYSGKSTLPLTTSIEPLYATTPIYRYFHSSEGYRYFLSDKHGDGLQPGIKWFVHPNQAAGTVPLYRMRNGVSHRYLFTRDPGTVGFPWVLDADPAIGDGGLAFYIYPNAGVPETAELHRFRHPVLDYFFTIDRNDSLAGGMTHEDPSVGWVHPTRSVMSPTINPIDDPLIFIRQHYHDFLSRDPDDSGLNFWLSDYNSCFPADLPCIDNKRNNISSAFFLSIEFQETGYFVYRFYKASYNMRPRREQLYPDKAIVSDQVIVGNPGWEAQLSSNKLAFANGWVGRQEFTDRYNGKTNAQYVDELYANAGIVPNNDDRTALINGLNNLSETRATVLRKIVDTPDFIAREKNSAYVLMEYFGYLQRNPDEPPDIDFSGFDFWLNKLNNHGGNAIEAEMVKSFLVCTEYRARFGQPSIPNSAANLTPGTNISVKAANLGAKFSSVATAGEMQVKPIYPWTIGQPPAGYTFFKNLAWKVTTTSSTSPPYTLTVNIPWEVADPAEFAKLHIFSREGNAWIDRTILAPDSPAPDFNGRTLSARVNTLSTVIVAHEGDTQTSLSLTSPSEGATFNAPASIGINTSSYDPDGVIERVQFYNGSELIGDDTTVPYSLSWSNVAAGTYAITARALDNMGVNIASATRNVVVNGPPIVAIVSPLAGTSLETPANITFDVYASSITGITKVEFFQGTTKLGEDTTAPYSFNWNSVGVGTYNLTAKATNTANLTATSSTATITVVNTPPTVSITSPGNGASLGDAPANVIITANAADSHGVKNVEFFKNGVSLGIDTTAPYSFSWNNVPVGTFNLTAKATDNLDAFTISAPVSVTVTNAAPMVSITAPAPNTAYTAPASITINAAASDNEGISKVEFFQNSTKLGEDTTAPYSFTWTNAGSGTYSLTARATDGQNATTTSSAVNVTVNAPPSITLTSPANGATYIAPAGVVLEASASDTDGTITQVEFFQNGASIGLDTSAPYSISWAHVPFGSYSLTARATDDRGAAVTSNVVNITVNPASTVLITSPNNNAVFIGGATIVFSANATDSDGVSKVEFFQGSTKLGEDTSSPYSYDWTDVAAGDYSITARATDTLGEITNSAAMNISVLPQVKQFVGWSSVSNGLDLGNGSVRKTSTGTWDFSANSLQKLLAGDGYFESTAANYDQSIGLSGSDGASRALVIGNGGWAAIYENGQEVANTSPMGNITPHAPGDRYRVEITNGVLRYIRYRSGAREVMFTSAAALPAYPIALGLGMSPQNAEWQKTVLAQLTRKVTWSAIVNGVDLGNGSVRKTSTGVWDFSATAKQTLLRGDGYFESTASYWNHSINVSGSNGAGGSLVIGTGGWAALYENGQEVANTSPMGNLTPHLAGDRYRVEIANGVLRYVRYRSGARAVLYTSTNPLPAYPLSFSLGSSFQNSEWQNTVIAQLSQTASWSYINNGIDLGNGSVRKTSTGTWDFSAGPRQQLVSGSGYFESTASYWNHSINISGSNGAGGSLVLGTGGWAALYENGQEVANTSPLGNIAPHASGDRYRLEISNGKLRYVRYRSSVRSIMFTSANSLPAYAMSYSLGSSFQNSEWQNTVFSDNLPEHNDASFVSQSVPATMVPGQTYTVSVTMRNTGASTWTPDGDYQLASENPADTQRWGVTRVNLNSIVLPGSDGTFSFMVTAPAAGTHNFQWRMVQQGVQRFGALTSNVSVQTTNGAAAPGDDSNVKAGSNESVNDPPFAALTMPATGAAYEAPASIEIEASAYDTDGHAAKVEFFANGASIGEDRSAPFSLTWKNVPAGSYSLTVVVTDDRNATMTSAPVNITVNNKLEEGSQDATGADSAGNSYRRNNSKSGPGDIVLTSGLRVDKPPSSQVNQRSLVLRSKNRRE